jgi:dienelactone hydrolase
MKIANAASICRAALVPGYDAPYGTLSLKVHYPCLEDELASRVAVTPVAADETGAPFPVVILMPALGVSHEAYNWLARRLAAAGYAVVTYSWLTRMDGGSPHLSPGVEDKRLKQKHYGKKPSCPALPVIYSELRRLQKKGPLAELLDLDKLVLGGHGLGGALALLNADSDWFPGLRGAFSYGAHCLGDPELGWAENSVIPLTRDLPLLIMGGARDGIVARGGDGAGPVERTFHEGIRGKRNDRYLVIVESANHAAFVHPTDVLASPADGKSASKPKKVRHYLGNLVINFCHYVCTGDALSGAELQGLGNSDSLLEVRTAQK